MSEAAEAIWHRAECDRSRPIRERGITGDRMIARCTTCGRYAIRRVAADNDGSSATVAPGRLVGDEPSEGIGEDRQAVPAGDGSSEPGTGTRASGFVCVDHGRPVNWKGAGCPECRAKPRRHRRRAQRRRDAND